MRGTSLADLPGWASRLLAAARVARLGLLDDRGAPRVQPVTFCVHDGALWSAVDSVKPKRSAPRDMARLRWAQARPAAALTVDHYEDDWTALAWVQVLGAVAVREAAGEPGAVAALASRYPPYAERPPSGPLLRLAPEAVLWWRAAG